MWEGSLTSMSLSFLINEMGMTYLPGLLGRMTETVESTIGSIRETLANFFP